MKRFLSVFSDSAKELTHTSCIVMTGMLIAVYVLLSIFVQIPIGETIKISFSFLALAAIGMLYGPVPGAIAGAITDILGFLAANKTGGAYHPGFTLVQVTAGFIYGLCLYKAQTGKFFPVRCAAAKILVDIICNLLMNTYFISVLYGTGGFVAMLPPRIVKNVIMLPIDIVLLCVVLPAILTAYRKIFGNKRITG
ncbi:folate family ECF transporter S component [Porcipelethomonas sp.]|uniref:folate family ECF transporter S component n=1 Tax=Porcipelethomonas sp. TaxID=2981675 RepID=UPI003EF32C61